MLEELLLSLISPFALLIAFMFGRASAKLSKTKRAAPPDEALTKLRNLNETQKEILLYIMMNGNVPSTLNAEHEDVKELVEAGILSPSPSANPDS
jgi:hypothetical protein